MTEAERHRRRAARALLVAFLGALLGMIGGFAVANLQSDRANEAEQGEQAAKTETGATKAATRDILTDLLVACDRATSPPAVCPRAERAVEAIDNGDPITVVGPAGPRGADGADGTDGRDGRDGATGPRGPRGATGATGAGGTDGADGANGADGQGTTGPAGPAGPQGPTGATGAQGPAGPAGQDGKDGADGQPCPDGYELEATTLLTADGPVDAYVCRADASTQPGTDPGA